VKTNSALFKFQIIFVYLIILVLSGAVSFFVYQTGHNISVVNHRLTDKQLPLLGQISELKHWINEHERILYEHYATEDLKHNIPKLILAQQNITQSLSQLKEAFPENKNISQLIDLNKITVENANQMIEKLTMDGDERWTIAREMLASISRMGRSSQPLINSLRQMIDEDIEYSHRRSDNQLSNMSSWVSAFSILILMIAIFVGYYTVNTLKNNYEKRRLALFIEKSPNAIASVNWFGEVEFENVSWRKSFRGKNQTHFIEELKTKLVELKLLGESFMQWQTYSNGEDLEIDIHKISRLDQVMVFVENISDRVKAQKELEFLAFNDPLTGLANAKRLEIDLENQLQKGPNNKFLLLTVGMKRLKLVSTTHGYSVSDELMKSLVSRVQNAVLPLHKEFKFSRVYRFTGAKFSILLAGPRKDNCLESSIETLDRNMASAMRKSLETLFGSFFLDYQTGCVIHPEHGYSANMLVKNVNAAVADAQKNNQTRINMFDQQMSLQEQTWYQLENDLRAARFDDEFYLTYQPKIDLESGDMVSMEALVRWQHPSRGLVSPVEFIPIAEESGMIMSLGLWVLNNACRQTKSWQLQGLTDLQVAVNVSPSQLLSANFLKSVLGCLADFELDARFLEIEITEEVLASDQENCIAVLNQIRDAGISVAVDDFGTGYSSLGYLNQFPISKLKIDRSFVTDIDKIKSNHAIVDAIIALSQKLGIKVIAEGIETEQELAILKTLQCDQGQGYLFNRPLAVPEFTKQYIAAN